MTSPREYTETDYSMAYESDNSGMYQDPLRMPVKRDQTAHVFKDTGSSNSVFQEYQFLSPGLFFFYLITVQCSAVN